MRVGPGPAGSGRVDCPERLRFRDRLLNNFRNDEARGRNPGPRPSREHQSLMTKPTSDHAHPYKSDAPTNGKIDAPKPRRRRSSTGSAGEVVPLHGHRHTDLGNSERVVQQHAHELRYVHDTAQWMTWDGGRWATDSDRSGVMQQVIETVRSMYRAAADPDSPEDRKKLAEWAITSESRPRLEAAVHLSAIHSVIRVGVADLDRDTMSLGVANGVIDLRTGVLRDAVPADLMTAQIPTAYDPDAVCPLWMATLRRILPDPEVRAFLQRAVGYSLTGSTDEQVLFLAEGRGANGKSVVVETIMSLLGDYAQKAPQDLLMARPSGSDVSNDVARLRGVRFTAAVETEEGRRLAESKVKELTGGDTITARFLHKEFFSFRPVCKVWLVTNHRPQIKGTDDGIWRRIVTVPFGEYIAPHERDKRLTDKLRAELPGILAWAVRGCLDWQRQGLNPPRAITAAGQEYRQEQDVLGGFIAERCVVREGVSAPSSALYREYQSWSQENGHGQLSQTSFGIKLRERGFVNVKSGTITWQKIGVRADHFGPDDGDPLSASTTVDPEPAAAPSFCRSCGETCDPVCNGLHVNCTEPKSDDDGPDDDGDGGSSGGGTGPDLDPEPLPTMPAAAADVVADEPFPPAPAVEPVQVVTTRRRRPWTPKSTVYLSWSTGRGVDDAEREFTVPKRATAAVLLAALPADTQRVILVGPMPGGSGPGLQDWVTDEIPTGWSVSGSGHYLDPDALAARYTRPDGGDVHVHRLASWCRDTAGSIRPATAAAGFRLFRDGLAVTFGKRRQAPGGVDVDRVELAPAVLSSPASTGRELLLRTLPAGHEYPVLAGEHLELLHRSTGQGRNELLTEDPQTFPADELPGLYGYDQRWSYAALCRGITGSGPAVLDTGSEFLGWAPARYEVEFTVPAGWDRLGLLGVHGLGWPRTGRHLTWCDARELRLAQRWGWRIGQEVKIRRRLRFTGAEKSTPLRTWADKLTELRESWLPAQHAPQQVIDLARDMARTVLLASLGALQGRRQKVTHSLPQHRAAELPAGVVPQVSRSMLVWQTESAAGWREMVHPEWVGQVWAEQRCRLLDTGPKAAQPNVGALHVSLADLVALRTDAVYLSVDPGWADTGRIGAFRPQTALPGPIPTPRSLDELLTLRSEG